jgi:hypothetical protein
MKAPACSWDQFNPCRISDLMAETIILSANPCLRRAQLASYFDYLPEMPGLYNCVPRNVFCDKIWFMHLPVKNATDPSTGKWAIWINFIKHIYNHQIAL